MNRPSALRCLPTIGAILALSAISRGQCPGELPCTDCLGSVTGAGSKVVYAGGSVFASAQVRIYDEATDGWIHRNLSESRVEPVAITVGERVFVAGGRLSPVGLSSVVDIYDLPTDSWSTTHLSVPRSAMRAGLVGRRILFAGGFESGPFPVNDIEVYDTVTGEWSVLAPLDDSVGQLLATAGLIAIFEPSATLSDTRVFLYDDQTGAWSTDQLSVPRFGYGAVTVGPKIFIAGGRDEATGLPSRVVDVYDVSTQTWSATEMPFGRVGPTAMSLGDRLVVIGGTGADGLASDLMQIYETASETWSVTHLSFAPYIPPSWAATNSALHLSRLSDPLVIQRLAGVLPLAFCFGDGSGADCPCGNDSVPGRGCPNSGGAGARLDFEGSTCAGLDDLQFAVWNVPAFQPALLFAGEERVRGGDGLPFGDGLRCAGAGLIRLETQAASQSGWAGFGPGLGGTGEWGAGDVRRFQVWYRDPSSGCGAGFNLSNGVELEFGI